MKEIANKKEPSAGWRMVGLRLVRLVFGLMFFMGFAPGAKAQSADLTQLILDIEKLTQLKGILTDMKTGYTIVNGGYNEVKQIASGNLNVHTVFLDGLLAVSPAVAKYGRVADIVLEQGYLVSEYKSAYQRFRGCGSFNPDEIAYLSGVYSSLLAQSLQNLDQLAMVLTSGKLRMSDDERIRSIDRIYGDTEEKLSFLRHFNRQTNLLAIQRQKEQVDAAAIRQLYP
jgi:hypothetical protein